MTGLTRRQFGLAGASLGLAAGAGLLSAKTASAQTSMPFLRGTNFGGMNLFHNRMRPATPAVDYYIRQKRMNVIRLCLLWENVQPALGGAIDPKEIADIQDQIDRITQAGAYVILELHNYGRRRLNGQDNIIGETPHVTAAHFADVWKKIADLWNRNPQVIFELMNEPHGQDTKVLVDVSNAAIAAIRATGARNLIMVSGNDWNSLGWTHGRSNRTEMLRIEDPLDHFCFDVHHYFDTASRGQARNVREDALSSMEDFTAWARLNGRKGFCGEFGCGINRRGLAACKALLDHIEDEKNRDVYVGWCWWGSGGCWQPDYIYLLDPFAVVHAATNPDPAGSASWADPVDRPQMKLLQDYLPREATPFNGWLIEDRLAPRLKAVYRRGDYQQEDGKWLDGNPDKPVDAAFGGWSPPEVRSDDGFAFPLQGQFFRSGLACGDRTQSVYAIVTMAAANASADRTILGAEPDEGDSGRSCGVATDGSIDITAGSEPFQTSKGGERVEGGRPVLVQAGFSASTAGKPGQKHLAVDAGPALREAFDASSLSAGGSLIGAKDRNGGQGLGGILYDLAVFSDELDEADNHRVQGRLSWDAGLAHLLPDSHPYRKRPPATA